MLLADGTDGTVVNVEVRDRKGRTVPDASDLISFSLDGDVRIRGVGNGDPSCHEPDKCPDGEWKRSLFNGRCQLILQSGKTVGEITLTASAEGLHPARITIECIR